MSLDLKQFKSIPDEMFAIALDTMEQVEKMIRKLM